MPSSHELTCRCGKVHLTVADEPITVAECQCDSCRTASALFTALPGAAPIVEASGGTHYVLYRKDRVRFTAGTENFLAYRLRSRSGTRRVVAACCNTPLFTEFESGHWLSLYAGLWPKAIRPAARIRTMVGDVPAGQKPPDDMPNYKAQSLGFFWQLLTAWVAMGFRVPAIAVPREIVVSETA